MTRQWRKEKQSELPKPGFVWTYEYHLTLIFHTLCRGGVLLSGVRTSENQITPGAHLYTPVHHQWTNSVLCELCKFFGRVLLIAPGGWVNRDRQRSAAPIP